ncbi:hypothetical protein BDV24DRAFT_170703 [Aspergillus arachidicola]|uniref:NADH:ubiquinone oxidoreductase intermediate-associated protein 30 domain-containing protein n=2 Tax=Aspergillus arachidicola TaxID=656916 RepID=A0A5N6YQ15_9EURO|nr:hypothetical protein BDV24DRAFT_170703 [Aspergillus arachidicola]
MAFRCLCLPSLLKLEEDLGFRGYAVTATVRSQQKADDIIKTHPSWKGRVNFVDVRDVARSHVDALTNPAAGGRRILLISGLITPQLVVNIIRKHFPALRDKVPEGKPDQVLPDGVHPTGWDMRTSADQHLTSQDQFQTYSASHRSLPKCHFKHHQIIKMDSKVARLPLFGGPRAWHSSDWTSTDDRVRGGSSRSHMSCSPASLFARFHGNLDITTLGGAGFASQRTTGEDRSWDLSGYDGLELHIARGDDKLYTITLKDETAPKRPDGRQESTLSWEYDFHAHGEKRIFIKWADFKPTYRGKEQVDARPLDLTGVKQFSFMMRSFFGIQEGDFSLDIVSIAAVRYKYYRDDPEEEEEYVLVDEKLGPVAETPKSRGWLGWIGECCGLS